MPPDLIYLPDDNGDNKADGGKVLYTGFGLNNIQQILNSFRWGIDNWVYAVNGSVGGTITCPDKPDMKPLVLRGQGIRFKPDVPGSIEPTSGGGQYGLTCDEAQHWFVNTNSSHLRQIVLPDQYLKLQPVSRGAGGDGGHSRSRRRLQSVPHQPVRAMASGADDTTKGRPGCQTVSQDRIGAGRIHHVGVLAVLLPDP